jgi:hypothetical protein
MVSLEIIFVSLRGNSLVRDDQVAKGKSVGDSSATMFFSGKKPDWTCVCVYYSRLHSRRSRAKLRSAGVHNLDRFFRVLCAG